MSQRNKKIEGLPEALLTLLRAVRESRDMRALRDHPAVASARKALLRYEQGANPTWEALRPVDAGDLTAEFLEDPSYAGMDVWKNDQYVVVVDEKTDPNFVRLGVSRRDGQRVRSWRDMQRIKNQMLGAECEAVELYPAESRLVDVGDVYHMWGERDPVFRWGFGFSGGRLVDY